MANYRLISLALTVRVYRSTDQTTRCCFILRNEVVSDSGKGRDLLSRGVREAERK
ncbi:hypothetical protein FORC11_p0031 (plasmid) [Shigella sonnei]|uniref:Uncharacterized protein n=1 Tax=Shigella sonnei TaxID=624 RepID=A0A896Z8H1_SHISO|nr:hypothetical protein FORC11_p0031 [Shigella sonnei]QSE36366.1 hypothetical protein NOOHOHFM_00074 [Shigella sonnei]